MARPARRSGNLPAEATSFVGRRRELAELRKKLAAARVVSLVGPGGVGKSRLAIRAATDLGRGFRGGAWLVELSEVRVAALVTNAVMAALDLRDQAASEPRAMVLSYLRDRELLLVVDNSEHLLEAAAELVNDVIRAAPGVRVIATSREPLAVPGEHLIPVPPLELPAAEGDEPLHQLRQNEAVMLFTERAAAASGRFELTEANRVAVVDLCRRLDGLPLAIELAAVRTRVLSVEQILDRLSDRFGLLTGGGRAALPRHHTLRTTIDWSHDLLEPAERAVLRRLCVFAGRFTLEDVESVCTSDHVPAAGVLDLLSSLVDKSLVMKDDVRGLACHRLHETMREYAHLKLREAGEEEAVERRSIDYYTSASLLRAVDAQNRLVEYLAWMDLEIDNIRPVLRRCLVKADLRRGIDLATSLGWYWVTRATSEGIRWLDELLAHPPEDGVVSPWAYFIRAFLSVLQGDPKSAWPPLERAVAIAQATGELSPLTHSLSMSAIAQNMAGDRAAAERFLDQAQQVSSSFDDVHAAVSVLQARVFHGFFGDDLDAVRSAATEGARLSREVRDLYSLEMMLMNRGLADLFGGNLAESRPLLQEALRTTHQIDDRVGLLYQIGALGCQAAATNEPRLAARLLGATENLRAEVGGSINDVVAPFVAQARESAAAMLGQSRFDAEFKAGTRIGRHAAVALALGETADGAVEASQDGRLGLLGNREADVARLVAEGLSNKQIGARLFISERTVDSHVHSILNKLGFNSRVQIASWMSSNQ